MTLTESLLQLWLVFRFAGLEKPQVTEMFERSA